ncbi:MAG: type IV pilus modification protein PilV [Thiohalomonadaceae bacterium]
MNIQTKRSSSNQRGMGLIEVLVAVLILSFGLLGLVNLQMVTLRNNQSSFDRSRAIMAVYSIADLMRADLRDNGDLDFSSAFLQGRIAEWKNNITEHLGSDAEGEIECASSTITPLYTEAITSHTCTITITWDDGLGVQGSDQQSITTQVKL